MDWGKSHVAIDVPGKIHLFVKHLVDLLIEPCNKQHKSSI